MLGPKHPGHRCTGGHECRSWFAVVVVTVLVGAGDWSPFLALIGGAAAQLSGGRLLQCHLVQLPLTQALSACTWCSQGPRRCGDHAVGLLKLCHRSQTCPRLRPTGAEELPGDRIAGLGIGRNSCVLERYVVGRGLPGRPDVAEWTRPCPLSRVWVALEWALPSSLCGFCGSLSLWQLRPCCPEGC